MTSLIAGLLLSTVSLTPTDDVWVYPHAGDPSSDPFLRVWGAGGKAIASEPGDVDAFSYAYLRFALPADFDTSKVKSAKLVLTHIGTGGPKAEDAKLMPIKAYAVNGDFREKDWVYELVNRVSPDAKLELGTALPFTRDGEKEFKIEIPLATKELDAAKLLARSIKNGHLVLALTASIDVQELGMKSIYKVYSKDTKTATDRPRLEISGE